MKEQIYKKYFPEYNHSKEFDRREWNLLVEECAEKMIKYSNDQTTQLREQNERLRDCLNMAVESLGCAIEVLEHHKIALSLIVGVGKNHIKRAEQLLKKIEQQ